MNSDIELNTNSLLSDSFKSNGKIFGGVAAIGGFVADVLQPIAPFVEYLLYIFFALFVSFAIAYILSQKNRQRLMSYVLLTLIVSVVSGVIFGLQGASKNNSGMLAEYVSGIDRLQSSLGILEKGIDDLKQDTAKIKQTTEEISSKIDKLNNKIGKQGGVISNPETPEEWYNNARVYELRGDYGNARRTYVKYFSFDGKYLDPHIRYQRFLKIQEGRAGAREIYNEMFSGSINPIVIYAKLLLSDNNRKRKEISAHLIEHTKFAPGYYELSRLYSKAVLGEQTLEDKKNESINLNKFFELDKQGNFVRYFIDKNEAARLLEDASSRYASLQSIGEDTFSNPFTINATRTNSGWSFNISIAENAQEIFYRLEGQSAFTGLGVLEYTNPVTKKPLANPILSAPGLDKAQKIEIKYRNSRGDLKGPYEYKFNPVHALRISHAGLLKRRPTSWVRFRKYNGLHAQLGHLMSRRCGISNIKYGIDKTKPSIDFALPDCNIENPNALPTDAVDTVSLPIETKMISLQITYSTGETSQVYSYNVPLKLQSKR